MSGTKETGNELRKEFEIKFETAVSQMAGGYIVAMLTDRFDIQRIEMENSDRKELLEYFQQEALFEKVIEIRVFNKEGEIKWFRSSIDKVLQYREKIDTKDMNPLSYWDEDQYLDIDTARSKPAEYRAYTTGGGEYPLPMKDYNNARVKVRNYLSYEEDTMQVWISDWRLVDFY